MNMSFHFQIANLWCRVLEAVKWFKLRLGSFPSSSKSWRFVFKFLVNYFRIHPPCQTSTTKLWIQNIELINWLMFEQFPVISFVSIFQIIWKASALVDWLLSLRHKNILIIYSSSRQFRCRHFQLCRGLHSLREIYSPSINNFVRITVEKYSKVVCDLLFEPIPSRRKKVAAKCLCSGGISPQQKTQKLFIIDVYRFRLWWVSFRFLWTFEFTSF